LLLLKFQSYNTFYGTILLIWGAQTAGKP
jgi:hypothetical protein